MPFPADGLKRMAILSVVPVKSPLLYFLKTHFQDLFPASPDDFHPHLIPDVIAFEGVVEIIRCPDALAFDGDDDVTQNDIAAAVVAGWHHPGSGGRSPAIDIKDQSLVFIVNLSFSERSLLAVSICTVTEYRHGPELSQGRGKPGARRPAVLSRHRGKQ